VNFFDPQCQSGPFGHPQFGLCDSPESPVAYVDIMTPENWTATVENPKEKLVTFTAIDKCVIKDGEERGRGRCDCMLTTDEGLYLIELKDRDSRGWAAEAENQLISTIEFLRVTHDISPFRHKKAFACNKKRKPFVTIDNAKQSHFFRTYGFRLDIQATVLIVS
jgi:hypothetical protein